MLYFTLLILLPFSTLASDPTIVTRQEWGAKKPKSQQSLKKIPPPFVVIHHSAGTTCTTTENCKATVRAIQKYHMDTRGWKDIGYNFLVGGDGLIYEARGWGKYGAHAPKFNSRSIGICVLGNFQNTLPSSTQLDALKSLIEYAASNSHITTDYKLLGHRQSNPTKCPGNKLYNEIETWPHFEPHPE